MTSEQTATERLRELLDERGVGYDARDGKAIKNTYWDDAEGREWGYTSDESGVIKDRQLFLVHGRMDITPEQAISATLGNDGLERSKNGVAERETCHYEPDYKGFTWWDENDVEHYEEYSASDECCSASCDKCGYTMMVGEDGWFDGWDEITEWTEEDGSEHKGYVLKPRFKFCPNCGKAVVDA